MLNLINWHSIKPLYKISNRYWYREHRYASSNQTRICCRIYSGSKAIHNNITCFAISTSKSNTKETGNSKC